MTVSRFAFAFFRAGRRRFAVAAALAALVPLIGLALMGISGWFVTASAVAGLAGTGLVFDFFRPSALIRLCSFGRAAARYGERLTGHDATLRALNGLRERLFQRLPGLPLAALLQLRSSEGLNRLTSDLDAIEGLLIRLIFPASAAVVSGVIGTIAVGWLLDPLAAGIVGLCHAGLLAALAALSGPRLTEAARAQETALQALRAETAEASRQRADAAMRGARGQNAAQVLAASAALETARAEIDRSERRAMIALGLAPMLAAAGLCARGAGQDPARLLAAILLALAMTEAPRQLWRGLAERGRMALAIDRIGTEAAPSPVATPAAIPAGTPQPGAALQLAAVQVAPPGGGQALCDPISLHLAPGDWAGVVAPSGGGKSSLLWALAGLAPFVSGQVALLGRPLAHWSETELRERLTLVTQRPAFLSGTVADNLRLAAPEATEGQMTEALAAVQMDQTLAPRGGLMAALGSHGSGFSGGQLRRLALARAVLRRPSVLLLDEPTEGLDRATAKAVLAGLRHALPETAVVIVSHRAADLAGVGQIVQLHRRGGPTGATN